MGEGYIQFHATLTLTLYGGERSVSCHRIIMTTFKCNNLVYICEFREMEKIISWGYSGILVHKLILSDWRDWNCISACWWLYQPFLFIPNSFLITLSTWEWYLSKRGNSIWFSSLTAQRWIIFSDKRLSMCCWHSVV